LEYELMFSDKEFKELFNEEGEIKLGVFISHTFGRLRKEGKTEFTTGYFTIK